MQDAPNHNESYKGSACSKRSLFFGSYFDSLTDEAFLPVELYMLYQADGEYPCVLLAVVELPQLYLHPAIIPLSGVAHTHSSDAHLLICSSPPLLISTFCRRLLCRRLWVQRDDALCWYYLTVPGDEPLLGWAVRTAWFIEQSKNEVGCVFLVGWELSAVNLSRYVKPADSQELSYFFKPELRRNIQLSLACKRIAWSVMTGKN